MLLNADGTYYIMRSVYLHTHSYNLILLARIRRFANMSELHNKLNAAQRLHTCQSCTNMSEHKHVRAARTTKSCTNMSELHIHGRAVHSLSILKTMSNARCFTVAHNNSTMCKLSTSFTYAHDGRACILLVVLSYRHHPFPCSIMGCEPVPAELRCNAAAPRCCTHK